VHSISLIPDQITRSIYVKEVAKQFELDEAIVLGELNKLRKQQLSKEHNEPQFVENPALTGTEPPRLVQQITAQKPKFPYEEFDLLRILVKYSQFALETDHLDEHGVPHTVEVSVAELICYELERDQLQFTYPLFNRIHTLITDGIAKKELFKPSYWIRHQDQEIVQFVTQIETEEHELSPMWLSKYNVDTNREIDKIKAAVMGAIYSFKNYHIQERIANIRKELEETGSDDMAKIADLLSEQIILERVKLSISAKLGRIITY